MKHLYPKEMMNKIGQGGEKKVYTVQGKDGIVVGEFHKKMETNNEMVRFRFYLIKILNYFYSEIPDIHLSSSNPQTVVMEKVDLDPVHSVLENDCSCISANEEQEHRYFKFAVKFEDNIFNDLGVNLDKTPFNYSITADGLVKYVDTVNPYVFINNEKKLNFDIKKIRAKIATIENERDRERLSGWADRLEGLANIA